MEKLNQYGQLIDKLWKDEALKNDFIGNPKPILEKEFGAKIPDGVDIQVLEETEGKHYFVIPLNPAKYGDQLNDAQLEEVAGGTVTFPVAVIFVTVEAC